MKHTFRSSARVHHLGLWRSGRLAAGEERVLSQPQRQCRYPVWAPGLWAHASRPLPREPGIRPGSWHRWGSSRPASLGPLPTLHPRWALGCPRRVGTYGHHRAAWQLRRATRRASWRSPPPHPGDWQQRCQCRHSRERRAYVRLGRVARMRSRHGGWRGPFLHTQRNWVPHC